MCITNRPDGLFGPRFEANLFDRPSVVNPRPDARQPLRVGLAGYSYAQLYPKSVRSADYLRFYAEVFGLSCVELNSTYYRRPTAAQLLRMSEQVPDDFLFTVKAYKALTHELPRTTILDVNTFNDECAQTVEAHAALVESGHYGGLLMQFPHSFRPSATNWEYLARLAETITVRPMYAEFRHHGWAGAATVERCGAMGVGVVIVDMPPLEGLYPWQPEVSERATWRTYVRLHGRNPDNPTPSRLNHVYEYSNDELRGLAEAVEPLPRPSGQTVIIFNNDHPANVVDFQQVLLGDAVSA